GPAVAKGCQRAPAGADAVAPWPGGERDCVQVAVQIGQPLLCNESPCPATNPRDASGCPSAPWPDVSALRCQLLCKALPPPRGSRCKYKYDPKTGVFRLGKLLPLGAGFPYNFGFVPSTRGEDGDALDVLVFLDEPVFAGCVVPVRLIGVLEAEQTEKGHKT